MCINKMKGEIMKMLAVISCLLITATVAHVCLINPPQRGGFPAGSLTVKGSGACIRVTNPPCYGSANSQPNAYYRPGETYNIVFQKNLDHYYPHNPGYFQLNILVGFDQHFYKTIFEMKDSSKIKSLDYVTVNVTMPDDGGVLQLIYHTNNPEAPEEFYQCADIAVKY